MDDVEALERPEQVAIARRVALAEMGVLTIGALLILTLSLRAYQTGRDSGSDSPERGN